MPDSDGRSTCPTSRTDFANCKSGFTWEQLKVLFAYDKLRLLRRDKASQARYIVWLQGIQDEYGTVVNYLLQRRLCWGNYNDFRLKSSLPEKGRTETPASPNSMRVSDGALPPIPADIPPYFTADIPLSLVSIIHNSWPYAIPVDVEHCVVWTVLPVLHPSRLPPHLHTRLARSGISGFTGLAEPPRPLAYLSTCLPALAEWGLGEEDLALEIGGEEYTGDDEALVESLKEDVGRFVKGKWKEEDWETLWWINPLESQSVLELAHIHVIARYKH